MVIEMTDVKLVTLEQSRGFLTGAADLDLIRTRCPDGLSPAIEQVADVVDD
jgi:hypothetical protein